MVTEIRHSPTVTVDTYQQASGSLTYGMLLGAFVAILAVLLISVCLYSKCRSKREAVVKEVSEPTPLEKVRAESGRLESVSLEQ